jgi:hypothetical protein
MQEKTEIGTKPKSSQERYYPFDASKYFGEKGYALFEKLQKLNLIKPGDVLSINDLKAYTLTPEGTLKNGDYQDPRVTLNQYKDYKIFWKFW